MSVDLNLTVENVTRDKSGTMISTSLTVEPIRNCVCEEDCTWNPSTCASSVIKL